MNTVTIDNKYLEVLYIDEDYPFYIPQDDDMDLGVLRKMIEHEEIIREYENLVKEEAQLMRLVKRILRTLPETDKLYKDAEAALKQYKTNKRKGNNHGKEKH